MARERDSDHTALDRWRALVRHRDELREQNQLARPGDECARCGEARPCDCVPAGPAGGD